MIGGCDQVMKLSFLHFEEAMSVGLEIQCIYLVPAIFFVQKMLCLIRRRIYVLFGVLNGLIVAGFRLRLNSC